MERLQLHGYKVVHAIAIKPKTPHSSIDLAPEALCHNSTVPQHSTAAALLMLTRNALHYSHGTAGLLVIVLQTFSGKMLSST